MSRICGYRCEHNKSGICQISVCDKKSNMQASYETSITNPEKQLEFYKQLSEQLQQENKQLKDNWNKLKKWLEKELGDRINPNKDKWLTGVYDAYRETIDKMQELEQGSDSNE